MRRAVLSLLLTGTALTAHASLDFEVVSIKRSSPGTRGGGLGTAPDGTLTMQNQPIRSILLYGSPVVGWERDGGWHRLVKPGGVLRARRVVVATNGYTPERLHPFFRERNKSD